jgi:hypothetical protein
LKALPASGRKRKEYEALLYAALMHLDYHVKPAIKEWDRSAGANAGRLAKWSNHDAYPRDTHLQGLCGAASGRQAPSAP